MHTSRQQIRNFLLASITTVSLLSLACLSFPQVLVQTQTTEVLKTKYEQQKREIESKQGEIKKNLNNVTDKYESIKNRKSQLSEEVESKKAEIAKVEQQITDTKVIISQLESQIEKNQKNIEDLQEQIKVILRQIQKQERVNPMHTVLTSQNLGEAIAEIYNLSSLQVQADGLRTKIETAQAELNRNKEMQTEIQGQLENTRGLLKSRQDNLQVLLEQTKGEQSKYEELLNSLAEQEKTAQAEMEKASGEYLAEVKNVLDRQKQKDTERANTLRAEAMAANQVDSGKGQVAGTTGTAAATAAKAPTATKAAGGSPKASGTANDPGPTGCSFEAKGSLDIPAGFFGPVTNGYVTQVFHCGHDGTDISAGLGTELYSIAAGSVVKKGAPVSCTGMSCNNGFGNYVVVEHPLPNGDSVFSLYAHMQSASPVGVGESVSKGQVVGYMGCTGYTIPFPCGVHVHFMMLDSISGGIACLYGSAKCYNPQRFIAPIN